MIVIASSLARGRGASSTATVWLAAWTNTSSKVRVGIAGPSLRASVKAVARVASLARTSAGWQSRTMPASSRGSWRLYRGTVIADSARIAKSAATQRLLFEASKAMRSPGLMPARRR